MTLIINCLTNDYVFQVSDRRLTNAISQRLVDDEANKSVLLCGAFAFGYTGLAALENERTDVWLSNQLVTAHCSDFNHALHVIRARATLAMSETRLSKTLRRHAFSAVGWGYLENKLIPVSSIVSNALQGDGKWKAEADPEFSVSTVLGLPGRKSFYLSWVGANLPKAILSNLQSKIGRHIGNRDQPAEFTNTMADAIREISKGNKTVGEKLMAVSLPREAIASVTPHQIILSSPAMPTTRSFWYMNTERADGAQFGPISVCGSSGTRDFSFMPASPDNLADGTVEVRMILPDPKEEERLKQQVIGWFSRAKALAPKNPTEAIVLFNKILLRITGRPQSNFLNETLVKTKFEMGVAHLDNGNFEEAKNCFILVVGMLKSFTSGEPLKYMMLAANNVGVAFLNEQQFALALPHFENAIKGIDLAKGVNQDFLAANGKDAYEIAEQVTKSLRNIGLCALLLGDKERAKSTLVQFESFAITYSTDLVQERIRDLINALASNP